MSFAMTIVNTGFEAGFVLRLARGVGDQLRGRLPSCCRHNSSGQEAHHSIT